MDVKTMEQIFLDTAYIRMGGSEEELRCAEYIKAQCEKIGGKAYLEEFEVDMADMNEAHLYVDGQEIACKGFKMSGNTEVEAPFYYLRNTDKYSLSNCQGKIVMIDGYMGYWIY